MRQALLIEGVLTPGAAGPADAPRLSVLADVLRAGGGEWMVRSVHSGRGFGVESSGAERELARACAVQAEHLLVVACGELATEPAVGVRVEEQLGGSSLIAIDDLARRLGAAAAHRVAVVIIGTGASTIYAEAVASTLAALRCAAIVAIGDPDVWIAGVVAGLRGAAREPSSGAISLASLAAYLSPLGAAARLHERAHPEMAWFEPPSLDQLWQLGGMSAAPAMRVEPPLGPALKPVIGAMLPGRFRVDAHVAEGSFGAVYRGRQIAVDREVAIKVVRAGVDPFSDEGRLFVHEIQAVARIDHRNVVRIYQADVTADGRLFFAMEWLPGRDLGAMSDGSSWEPGRAVALTQQLLAALDAAHQAGLVHADVKPGNAIVVAERDTERLVLVDFGLARLRRPDGSAQSVGGTPAFMAPEQLHAGLVDARSDQFSAALVLVWLLTRWHRTRASELAPGPEILGAIADATVRAALSRALATAPGERFASAATFSAALAGQDLRVPPPPQRPPFHGLAPLTEEDRDHLHGRDRELGRLTDLVFHRSLVIVTAPSGVGKTSLLRAGLMPRLAALHAAAHYVSCRAVDEAGAAATISPGAVTLDAAIGERARDAVVVVIFDQVEDLLDRGPTPQHGTPTLLAAAVASTDRGACVVLTVREDFLARLLDCLPRRGDGAPIMRVSPLGLAGAREAIVRPLALRRLAIEPALLDQLLADLVAAGQRLGSEFGWSVDDPVYPPHLQLACSVLYERLPADAAMLTLAEYRAAGGFGVLVGEHLERVLDGFTAADTAVARELLLALVGSGRLRAARTEDDLRAAVPGVARGELARVIEALRRDGVVVRARRADGEPVWELIHDSLVPRVLAWLDLQNHARRRAMELVRHHLRREQAGVLSRAELREIDAHTGLVAALEREWRSSAVRGVDPAALIAQSRRIHRRSRAAAVALGAVVVAGIGVAAYNRSKLDAETQRRDRNLGHIALVLSVYDWDADSQSAVPVALAELPQLAWTLHRPSFDDPDQPGQPMPDDMVTRLASVTSADGLARVDSVEAPGGAGVLVVTGRGRPGERCARSLLPLRGLPGYAQLGGGFPRLAIGIPTCRATLSGTIEIPAGPFVFGGPGEPPSPYQLEFAERAHEVEVTLASYWIDRTEITNAAFGRLAALADATGIVARTYVTNSELSAAAAPRSPATSTTWREAAVYCRYLGKRLPTSAEWEKALRGGRLLDGAPNPFPRRNFPWGVIAHGDEANLQRIPRIGPQPVGSFAADRSPYGVLDMAGNVMEWIGSPPTGSGDPAGFFRTTIRLTRGGNWSDTEPDDLVNFTPIENGRPGDTRTYTIGWRCVIPPP